MSTEQINTRGLDFDTMREMTTDPLSAYVAAGIQWRKAAAVYAVESARMAASMLRLLFPDAHTLVFGIDYDGESDTPDVSIWALRDAAGAALWISDIAKHHDDTLPVIEGPTVANVESLLALAMNADIECPLFGAGHGDNDDDASTFLSSMHTLRVAAQEPVAVEPPAATVDPEPEPEARDAFDEPAYRIKWNEISAHSVKVSTRDLADLLEITPEEVAAVKASELDTAPLADSLAEFDGAGFDGLYREDIQVRALKSRPV